MKKFTKLLGIVLILTLVMSMGITAAFAQTVSYTGADGDGATITISNAARGETYTVYKLFDATVTGTSGGSIAYQGTVPTGLEDYFVADSAGNISVKTHEVNGEQVAWTDTEITEALQAWAEGTPTGQVATAVSEGDDLIFNGLPYGYYLVTTTQGAGAVTVTSTNPNASIIDKNTTIPIKDPTKTADDEDVFIGQTVTYTISFGTANYSTENDDESKQIVKYIIEDNFAEGVLENVTVTSVKVGGTDIGTTTNDVYSIQFDDNGKIEIEWVDDTGKSLYTNGATIEITYTATVAASAAIDGEGNTNSVTIDYEDTDGEGSPSEKKVTKTIFTYALAIKKVDQSGKDLAGAVFELPFYVNKTAAEDGAYVAIDPTAYAALDDTAKANYTNSLTTPADGLIKIKGIQKGTYIFTETAAPAGYNKLTQPVSVEAVKTDSTTTSVTTYFDANGNKVDEHVETGFDVAVNINDLAATPIVVVNKTGTQLPSTGGIGTTIFYVVGSVLVIAAGILLITKKRMGRE